MKLPSNFQRKRLFQSGKSRFHPKVVVEPTLGAVMEILQLPLPEPEDPRFSPGIYAHTPELRGHTRAQALADEALIDVTAAGKEVGFKLPVAISEALHNRLTPTKAEADLGQDYDGRLWDVLWLAAFTNQLADRGTEVVTFTIVQQEVEAKSGQLHKVDLRLRAVCNPGDEGKPVVTIGFLEDF